MNTTNSTAPLWESWTRGQQIAEGFEIPPGEITIVVLIGDGETPCKRSEMIDRSGHIRLHDEVRKIKSECAERKCNMCCPNPTRGVGRVVFESWYARDRQLTVRLFYNKTQSGLTADQI